MSKGRPSKINKYNLSELVDSLKAKNYTNQEIAREINKLHPDLDIHHSSVGRYLRGETKSLKQYEPTEIDEAFNSLLTDVIFNLDKLESISQRDRYAIVKYIKSKAQWFSRYIRDIDGNISLEKGYMSRDRFNRFIVTISNEICPSCKARISELAVKELERRYHSE